MQELMKKRLRNSDTTTEYEMEQAVQDLRMESAGLGDIDMSLIQREDQAAINYLNKRIVPVIGRVPIKKEAGTWRFLLGNANGLATHRVRNFKATRVNDIVAEYDVDGLGFCEVGIDTRCFKASESITSFLQLQGTTKATVSHNKYQPKINLGQQGGCAIIALGEICQYAKVTKGGGDPRDLGRICSMVFSAHPNQRFRLVSGYNVGKPKPQGLQTVYQQILRYIQQEGLDTNPRKLMRDDLLDLLKTWLQQGDRIMLYMDANENVIDGPLCSRLRDLGFTPSAHNLHGRIPNTHVAGSECIDEVWVSHGLEVTGVQVLRLSIRAWETIDPFY